MKFSKHPDPICSISRVLLNRIWLFLYNEKYDQPGGALF
ncbi:hypothetical protein B4143_3065 [Bacillus subtilis]|uniref:Uncharacterized protein n=1 Tax=Bacillus subtilis TaxID=1423 RepID=A0AAP1H991_BACIU|nr:hypothetical protein B4146_3190 [Bacillus subtilis]CCU59497.1 hypothetical protein BSUBE1_2866 [Bacillus subtilis E1]KIO55346.1 hypothetical protein B4143_3065 [Bacillus subtilis]KZD93301.1 hypothetical protein B4122_1268 [Bacillus subtilis]RAP09728.1 hypothetical protein HS3_00131 [Bacillus subtilis]